VSKSDSAWGDLLCAPLQTYATLKNCDFSKKNPFSGTKNELELGWTILILNPFQLSLLDFLTSSLPAPDTMATNYDFLFERSFELTDKDAKRPHVTLTYAQSLDGKIAGRHGQQLILSGAQSMTATHM
jgi:hypothetical protein